MRSRPTTPLGLISLRPDKMGGGLVVEKNVSALEKNAGGVGVMPKYFIDVKKCWGVGLGPYILGA